MEPWIGLVDDFPVQPLAKFRYVGIKAKQFHVAGTQDGAADSGVSLNDGVLMVAVTAGIAVWHILQNSGNHNGPVLLMQFPEGRFFRFGLRIPEHSGPVHTKFRFLSVDGLFRLDFVILRLFFVREIATLLNQTGNPFGDFFPA